MRKIIFGMLSIAVIGVSGSASAEQDYKAFCENVKSCPSKAKWHTRYVCNAESGAVQQGDGKCICSNTFFVPMEQHGMRSWKAPKTVDGVTHYYYEKNVTCVAPEDTVKHVAGALIRRMLDQDQALADVAKKYIDANDEENRQALADLREELEDKDAQDQAEKEMLVNLMKMRVRQLVWLARRNQVYPSVGVIGWGIDDSWIGGGFVGFAHRSWITPTLPLALDVEARMLYAPDVLSSGEDGFQTEIRGAAGWGVSAQLRWERERREPGPAVALRGGPAVYQFTHTERDGQPIGVYVGGELGIDVQLERTGSFEVRPFVGLGRIWYGGPGNGVLSGYSGLSAAWVF